MGNERELIDTGTDKRYVRRDEKGQFKDSDDQKKSLRQDVKQHAETKKPRNQGIRGIDFVAKWYFAPVGGPPWKRNRSGSGSIPQEAFIAALRMGEE